MRQCFRVLDAVAVQDTGGAVATRFCPAPPVRSESIKPVLIVVAPFLLCCFVEESEFDLDEAVSLFTVEQREVLEQREQ